MSDFQRPLTTWLFVTAIDAVQIRAAAEAKPDCVIIDMEDFTPPGLREKGRRCLAESLKLIADAGVVPCVRINPTGSTDHAPDLAATLDAGARIISLPKTSSAAELHDLNNAISAHGGPGPDRPGMLPCIETAEGLVNTYAILKDAPPLIGSLVASEDMTTSLGAPRDRDGTAIRYARERFLLECRAAGVEPVQAPRAQQPVAPAPRPAPAPAREPQAAQRPAQAPVRQQAPAQQQAPAMRPAAPRPAAQGAAGQLDLTGRPAPQPRTLSEEDQLEIPAFLRRQAN